LVPNRLVLLVNAEVDRVTERRDQARRELGRMGTNAWPAIPFLLDILERQDLYTRYATAEALAKIRADQAPEFERLKPRLRNQTRLAEVFGVLLTGSDESGPRHGREVRCFALAGLAALGPGARSRLGMVVEITKAQDEDHEIRALALEMIRSVGSPGDDAVSLLKQRFQDREEWPDVRAAAIRALADVAPGDPQYRPLLREALRDSPGLVRIAAAETLWQLGSPAAEVLPVLADALAHKLASVRLAALKAVTCMGKAAQPIASAVRALLSDEKEPVRQAAAAALASMGLKKDQDSKDGDRGIR
jgi:HEAT repeat protein